jgi:hypothetical protein
MRGLLQGSAEVEARLCLTAFNIPVTGVHSKPRPASSHLKHYFCNILFTIITRKGF